MRKTARRQAFLAAGEAAQHVPAAGEVATAWLDVLRTGQIPVSIHLADLDRQLNRLEPVPRLLAAAILLTGLVIGSALAAAVDTGGSDFRNNVADVALVLFLVVTVVAVALVAALLWRLLRPRRTP